MTILSHATLIHPDGEVVRWQVVCGLGQTTLKRRGPRSRTNRLPLDQVLWFFFRQMIFYRLIFVKLKQEIAEYDCNANNPFPTPSNHAAHAFFEYHHH